MEKRYKIGMKNLIPLYGLKKFIDENPIPTGDNLHENRGYALRALPLGVYNLACTIGMAVGTVAGLEALLK